MSLPFSQTSSFCTQYPTLSLFRLLTLSLVTWIPAVQVFCPWFSWLLLQWVQEMVHHSWVILVCLIGCTNAGRLISSHCLLEITHSVTQCTLSTTTPMRFSWYTSLASILCRLSEARVNSGDTKTNVTLSCSISQIAGLLQKNYNVRWILSGLDGGHPENKNSKLVL